MRAGTGTERPAWGGRPAARAGWLVAGLAIVALLAAACGGGGKDRFSDPRLQTFDDALSAPGQRHLDPGEEYRYATVPPYGGPHDTIAVRCAVYQTEQPLTGIVHSMEHGAVAIYYQPDLFSPSEVEPLQQEALALLRDGKRVILSPSRAISSRIALAAWGAVLPLDTFDAAVVGGFVDAYDGQGPERVPRASAC